MADKPEHKIEKSDDPYQVPPKIKVAIEGMGPALAKAAKRNGRSLSEEIRVRLKQSLEADALNDKENNS